MEFQASVIFLFVVVSKCISAQLSTDGFSSQTDCIEGAIWQFSDSQLLAGNNKNTGSLLQNEEGSGNLEVNDTHLASDRDCYSNEVRTSFFDCPFRVEETYDANRLPQVISNVRCLQQRISNELWRPIGSHCEEVKLQMPVLRKNGNCSNGPNKYSLVWETATVACIRTVLPSKMISKLAHRVSFGIPS
ncbi:hypothetical protein HNY73_013412 [Argiope bruennichi]|uniref:Uncharacterized protein n=1 Tax=Argiope bruennichi TaxID=94029 RepID=A0A8T0F2S0_ARGBR|nr:hypothetical protein HNY73_013412 [Argiope bruennichi]